MPDGDNIHVVWAPIEGPQATFFQLPEDITEIFLAGGRGGGKTASILARFVVQANKYGAAARGLVVRRKLVEMTELKFQAEAMFTPLGAIFHVGSNTWRFKNGATLRLARLEDRKDAQSLQGQSYSYIAIDEAQAWPDSSLIDMLRATLRSAEGVPVLLCLTANPGGRGSQAWLKPRYVDPYPAGYKVLYDQHGLKRIFIPLNVDDNKILLARDPGYTQRLLQSGPAHLVRAWRYGDWYASPTGALSDAFNPEKHLLEPFSPPANWTLACGLDWGASRPSALMIFAYVTDSAPPGQTMQRFFPKGSMILLDELYTCATDDDGCPRYDVGTKLPNETLGELIAAKLRPYGRGRVRSFHADPNIFARINQPTSIYEQIQSGMSRAGWPQSFTPACQDRIAGLQLIRSLLLEAKKDTAERPGLWVCSNAEAWLATVPSIEVDPRNPEDCASDGADHCLDASRYAVFSKPRIARTMKVQFG